MAMVDVELHKKVAEHEVLLVQHSTRHDKHDDAIDRHEAQINEWRGWFRSTSIIVVMVSVVSMAVSVYAQMQNIAAHTPQKEQTK